MGLWITAILDKPWINIKYYKDTKVVTIREKYVKYVKRETLKGVPSFERVISCREGKKNGFKMNKLVYPGQKTLGLHKSLMYDFQYDCMQLKYGSKE